MPEQPLYVVYQDIGRVLFPKLIQLALLGGLLYFGLWLNLYLLDVGDKKLLSIFAIAGIIILIAMELLIVARKTKVQGYMFYPNRVEFGNKGVFYGNVRGVDFKATILDRIFGTGTILLHPYFRIQKIKNSSQIYAYVQRIIQTRPAY